MNIGIVGLGLIGGSMAKAIRYNTDHTVFGDDISREVISRAKLLEAIHGELTDEALESCDLLILALYPNDIADYVRRRVSHLRKDAVVVDCCGVNERTCEERLRLLEEHGFTYVGGHPMAGLEVAGFANSKTDLYKNASMILTPVGLVNFKAVEMLKAFFLTIGFSRIEITTPKRHDRMIAYTSQLAHIVSSAYVQSPAAVEHAGFSAGSFHDMTRVAKLNEDLWTALFFRNKEELTVELDAIVDRLKAFSEALHNEDADKMRQMLANGRKIKESLAERGPESDYGSH